MRLLGETTVGGEDPLGAPWSPSLDGSWDRLVVESELLADNPLGDPARRPLWVIRPDGVEPGDDGDLPAIYVIQGYFGQLDSWANRNYGEPTFIERVDALLAAADCPPAVVVLVDAWTSYGGSQFLDSAGTGRYQSYICDEIVPFIDSRYPTGASRERRGVTGKSSGGYGAMVMPMMRPDVFSGIASHAGDALFEISMLPEFANSARTLRDKFDGSYETFIERAAEADPFDFDVYAGALMTYGCAAAYAPDPDRPGKPLLPFEIETGRLVPEVWQRWLDHDPVRMAPKHADALRSMRHVYLDGGRSDEWHLDLGAQAFSAELEKLGVDHTLELFDGKHGGITYRYPGAIRGLIQALSS